METSTRRTIAYTLPWDNAPIDLSFVFEGEKPAGRHGFLQVRDGRMVFADGTEGRFWGTNFNGGANFPTHSYSEKVAHRLAKFGVNIVRFHQMDADWSTPNLFQLTKGRRLENTQRFDPQSMDRLDYLIHCLKQQGIYVYMDLLTYRKFRSGDGVAAADLLADAARPYSNFDPRLIELQKQFNEQLWNHVNPYTGLAYKDEPAIVLVEIVNENDLFTKGFRTNMIEPYRGQLERRYRSWAQAQGMALGEEPVNFGSDDPRLIAFLGDLQKAYYAEMSQHMRQLGVRIPITGTNWSLGGAALLDAQMPTDFTDSHVYWYDWAWKVKEKRFNNRSMLGERDPWFLGLSFFRVLHKPFFASEWDDPWPNEWRAESPLLLAAAAAFQGWSGAAIHTYRYDCRENIDQIAAPITSDAIGGVPYRGGVFDTFNDPAKFGLFYHAALLLRRGDVREPQSTTEIAIPSLTKADGMFLSADAKAVRGAVEMCKVGMRLPGEPKRADREVPFDGTILPTGASEIRSETGELYRNLAKRYAVIDSPRTKAAYGFLGQAGEVIMKGLTVNCRSDFAVIAISSLADADTAHASNLLLTAIGRADNTAAEYNADHTLQFRLGHGPVQVEVIEATIELATDVPGLRVWGINPAGSPIGQVPVTYEAGKLKFTLGGEFASMYYLIQQV